MYPQGVCRIRKPAYAGNGCAIFPAFETAQLGKKIRCSAEDDLVRVSQDNKKVPVPLREQGQKKNFCGTTLFAGNPTALHGANTPSAR